MITLQDDRLVITLCDGSPDELRDQLIKAIAGAMQWYALCPDKPSYHADYVATLCMLQEQLVDVV